LQEFCTSIFALRNTTDVFTKKLALSDSFVQKGGTEIFPTLSNLLTSADVNAKEFLDIIRQHLKDLDHYFEHDFPEHEVL